MATAVRWCLLVVKKARRCVRTVIFMVAMLASLLVSCLPVLVAIGDVVVPLVLVSNFTCLRCYGFKQHFHRYAFKSSLTDMPLVSVVRSFIIICVYTMCSTPALSHGPYLGTVTLCSFTSILLLSVKACLCSVHSQMETEASLSLIKRRRHLKKSWGMPVLFLSSAVFALGHTVVAYRTSCRAHRKLLFHRVDPEAVLSCKNVFAGFQKVPRSATPTAGRTLRSANEMRQKPFGVSLDEGGVPIRTLADINSLFITCQGIIVHYKICFPNSPPSSLSSTTFLELNPTLNTSHMALSRIKLERQPSGEVTKGQYHLPRSYSNHFQTSSLYAPLLDGSPTSAIFSEEIPVLNLDDVEKEEDNVFSSGTQDREENGKIGIILVHGFGGGVFSWRHVMGTLARQVSCTVVAFDRPGWGLSSRPRRKDWEDKELRNPYKLESQVDLLLSFCHELGFSSVVFVGHDDGGLLALMAAQRVKESMNSYNVTVNGVVLLSVSMSREVVPGFAKILLRTSLGKKHLVRPLLRTEIMQVVNRRAWYDATKLTKEVLNLYKVPLYVEGWDEALHEMGKLGCETVLSPQKATTLLKTVEDISVLVIAGAEDVLVPVTASQTMALQLANSRLVAISGCGHLPHEECPSALLAAMAPFISRICKTSSTSED